MLHTYLSYHFLPSFLSPHLLPHLSPPIHSRREGKASQVESAQSDTYLRQYWAPLTAQLPISGLTKVSLQKKFNKVSFYKGSISILLLRFMKQFADLIESSPYSQLSSGFCPSPPSCNSQDILSNLEYSQEIWSSLFKPSKVSGLPQVGPLHLSEQQLWALGSSPELWALHRFTCSVFWKKSILEDKQHSPIMHNRFFLILLFLNIAFLLGILSFHSSRTIDHNVWYFHHFMLFD